MVLNAEGEVIGWCVWSQLDDGTPAGVNDVRPINLLGPALEGALAISDPTRSGATITNRCRVAG